MTGNFYFPSAFHVANAAYLGYTLLGKLALEEGRFASRTDIQPFLSKSSKFNDSRLRNQFFLLSIRIDDDNNYSQFYKKGVF